MCNGFPYTSCDDAKNTRRVGDNDAHTPVQEMREYMHRVYFALSPLATFKNIAILGQISVL